MWNFIEKIIYFFIYKVFRLKLSEGKYQAFLQFVKFGIVGLSNTVVSYVIYLVTIKGLEAGGLFPKVDYIIATVVSFVLSVLWSFYWNKKFVFNLEGDFKTMFQALVKTYISYSFTGLFLNSVLAIFWVEVVGMSKLLSPILNLLISVPINFLLNKFWAFKDKDKAK